MSPSEVAAGNQRHERGKVRPSKEDCMSCRVVAVGTSYFVAGFIIYQMRTNPLWKANTFSKRLMYVIAAGIGIAGTLRMFDKTITGPS